MGSSEKLHGLSSAKGQLKVSQSKEENTICHSKSKPGDRVLLLGLRKKAFYPPRFVQPRLRNLPVKCWI